MTHTTTTSAKPPLTIRMHPLDNVAIVANHGGLAAGTLLASGLVLHDRVPQGHKVALADLATGAPVLRYGIPIGHALKAIPAGSWVHERLLQMPDARGLDDLPVCTLQPAPLPALEGYSFEGFRNASVADRGASADSTLDVVCLQDDAHVGFMRMVDSIIHSAQLHLERLNARRRETVPASELVVGVPPPVTSCRPKA